MDTYAYLGEIRMFAGTFAPAGWMFCDGSPLLISENDALYALIGVTYGGDGQSNFLLPDLRGRIPVHVGAGVSLGQSAGTETATLNANQIGSHTHSMQASQAPGSQQNPSNNLTAASQTVTLYYEDAADTDMSSAAIGSAGGGQPHDNMQPYLCVSFIICTEGQYPPQS